MMNCEEVNATGEFDLNLYLLSSAAFIREESPGIRSLTPVING